MATQAPSACESSMNRSRKMHARVQDLADRFVIARLLPETASYNGIYGKVITSSYYDSDHMCKRGLKCYSTILGRLPHHFLNLHNFGKLHDILGNPAHWISATEASRLSRGISCRSSHAVAPVEIVSRPCSHSAHSQHNRNSERQKHRRYEGNSRTARLNIVIHHNR